MSYRRKLTLTITVCLVCLIVSSVIVLIFLNHAHYTGSPTDMLKEAVQSNANIIAASLEGEEDFQTSFRGVSCALYTDTGTRIIGRLPEHALSKLAFVTDSVRSYDISGETYYVYDLYTRSIDNGFWVRGAVGSSQFSSPGLIIGLVIALIIPLLISILMIAWFIDRTTLLPVERLAASVSEIEGDRTMSRRVDSGGSSELRRIGSSINVLVSRLERSSTAHKQFTSDVSHELRTPITVILAECEHAKRKCTTSEDYLKSLDVIEKEGKHMSSIVESLLALTRMEGGSDVYPLEPHDLSLFVESCYYEAEALMDKGISLESFIEPGLTANFNELLLSHGVMNLLGNAVKYGKENGHVRLSLSAQGNMGVITVSDDGIGISEENLDKIWNRFWQADPSHSSKNGCGLGLSLVKEIALYHNGYTQVSSILGEGSSFRIFIPLCES